ncbi:putative DNA-binding protein [Actinacidiphila reveromycinica]|uniref:Putative DNA-binding protein n=1 Tax=Actinacidiphila reveromycinica TaxID=659352 RepID=A0A7U3VQ98_9ACTN|nr:helix-turn-helix transcriptional regulator [Streptomyces sp. SN-593]BBA99489.1 putative DNA-binding protein [Streptomyces sp. SN-593]
MANPGRFATKKLDTTLSARALYGAELRYFRERMDLTLRDLADRLHIEMSFLARIEQGERRLPDELAAVVDELLHTGGFFERNLEAARSAPRPDRLTPLAEWEWLAVAIREWDAALVPGLLQTDAYAQAVADTYGPLLTDRTQRHRWEARLSRTPVLLAPHGPRYTAVLGEAVLRRPLGGPVAMAVQLDHLAGLVRSERVTLNVLPLIATPHPSAMDGALRVMTFADETPAVHFTSHRTGAYGTEPATVALAHLTYDLLSSAALPADVSLDLIEAAAEGYRAEGGTRERPSRRTEKHPGVVRTAP